MGFYSKLNKKEDSSFDEEDTFLEEQYQKLYKKIARDFVHIDDFNEIVSDLLNENKRFLVLVNLLKRENAILKGLEYKDNLQKPRQERKAYSDIIGENNE